MMLRGFVYLLLVAAAALGLAWFADRPGSLTLQWLGYEIETSVFVAVVAIIGVVSLLLLSFGLITWLIGSPKRCARACSRSARATRRPPRAMPPRRGAICRTSR
jgi:HemY protein